MNYLRRLLLTISYVTCLHLTHVPLEDGDEHLAGLSKYLPLAGFAISAILMALFYLLVLLKAPCLLSGLLLATAWLVLSNGLHFDGLMDTADGIFSHQNPKRMLEIMSDSRVGNFGVMVGFVVFLLKFVALAFLPRYQAMLCLIFIPMWSRFSEAFAIAAYPYAKEFGKGKIWHDSTIFPRDTFKAAFLPAAAVLGACLLGHWQTLLVVFFTVASGLLTASYLNAKLGGQTGDTYGTVVEFSEVAALVAMALIAGGLGGM